MGLASGGLAPTDHRAEEALDPEIAELAADPGRVPARDQALGDAARDDIKAVCDAAHARGEKVKVIYENAYLTDEEKVTSCKLCDQAGDDWVKTSTGFAPSGATLEDLRLMRANVSGHIQVKAAGGVRTLPALLDVIDAGVTRCGATATATILDDFKRMKDGAPPAPSKPDSVPGTY